MGLSFDKDTLTPHLQKFSDRAMPALMMLCTTEAVKLRSDMQINRPWTDRTGEAKRQLNSFASQIGPTTARITLAHGVWYGKYLELAHEKKYAIIAPTIKTKGKEFFYNDFKNFLSIISGGV